jgi:hypothetical protein
MREDAMAQRDPQEINRLIGEFMELQESWQQAPGSFDWKSLQLLAQRGAFAYNDGAGPSFHSLALDGIEHEEFHERFLGYSLDAGFDPFKLTRYGSTGAELPVIDHADLALAARSNPVSARMRSLLMALARTKFNALAQPRHNDAPEPPAELRQAAIVCAESLPLDLLDKIAPELAESQRRNVPRQSVDPIEGYLTTAEVSVDRGSEPYG